VSTYDEKHVRKKTRDYEELFAHAVRAHWGIENRLHYMLDVVYREDASRVRKDYSPRTLALIRTTALTIARSDKE
jgi:predicted transposase YbfD/YdcC